MSPSGIVSTRRQWACVRRRRESGIRGGVYRSKDRSEQKVEKEEKGASFGDFVYRYP